MKPKTYEILYRALCDSVPYGIRRFYKHREDTLTDVEHEQLADAIIQAATNEICEWFDIEEDKGMSD